MLRYFFNVLFFFYGFAAMAQSPVSTQQEATQLIKNLLEHHVSPRPVDDSFSKDVFDIFIKLVDADKLFFTRLDIDQLSVHMTTIDDELNSSSWKFLPEVTKRLEKNLRHAETVIARHTAKPFDFMTDELHYRNADWAADEKEIGNRWRLHLKFETLNELVRIRTTLPAISNEDFLLGKEADARNVVKKSAMRTINRLIDHSTGYEEHIASLYLRAIGLAFDPHSTHLSFSEMNDYVTSLGTEGYYFGITISESERGEIMIGDLTPGGAAWRSGNVHSGDVIEKVRWGANEWIDVEKMTRDEMNELLMESNNVVMEFMLKEGTGLRKSVLLKKEKMDSEENVVKSLILEGDKKIGYISLPGFYSAWGGSESSRCANDVAKEILKLKKENIEGIILDVRYNRGGSLFEAVAMAGIFIDAGPMGMIKDQSGAVTSVKDMNRGTVYDGPLILMVNGLSASASEFLAAALQDHNRAVIVGSKTYGKATGQRIFPMQPGKVEIDHTLDVASGWGFSTITAMKIYRVTGKTAQKHGVTPDITLPDLYNFSDFGESYATGALPSDSVTKKAYYSPLKPLPLQALRSKSATRVNASEAFRLTRDYSKQLVALKERLDTVNLTWTEYNNLVGTEAGVFSRLRECNSRSTDAFKIGSHAFNQQRLQMDDYARQQNENWTGNLSTDISLEEAYYIICDYIAAGSAN
jgi:carboxyl-terminal processing protease